MKFCFSRIISPPYIPKMLSGTFRTSFGPAILLAFDGAHHRRKLCWRVDIGTVNEFPAPALGAVAEIEILRQRVGLPVASVKDAGLAPYPARSVEVHKGLLAIPSDLFYQKMSVQGKCLKLGQQGIIPVKMGPTGLYHTDFRVSKM